MTKKEKWKLIVECNFSIFEKTILEAETINKGSWTHSINSNLNSSKNLLRKLKRKKPENVSEDEFNEVFKKVTSLGYILYQIKMGR